VPLDPVSAQSLHRLRLKLADLERRADSVALAFAQPQQTQQAVQAAVDQYLERHLASTLRDVLKEMMSDDEPYNATAQQPAYMPFVAPVPPPAATLAIPSAPNPAEAAATAALSSAREALAAAQQEVSEARSALQQAEADLLALAPDGSLTTAAQRAATHAALAELGRKASLQQRNLKTSIEYVQELEQDLAQAQQALGEAQQRVQQAEAEVQRCSTSSVQMQTQPAVAPAHQQQQPQQPPQQPQFHPAQLQQMLSSPELLATVMSNPAVQAAMMQALRGVGSPAPMAMESGGAGHHQAAAAQSAPGSAHSFVQQPPQQLPQQDQKPAFPFPPVSAAAAAAVPYSVSGGGAGVPSSYGGYSAPPYSPALSTASSVSAASSAANVAAQQPQQAYPVKAEAWSPLKREDAASPFSSAAAAGLVPPSAVVRSATGPQSVAEAFAHEGGAARVPAELHFLLQLGFRAFDFTFRTSAVNHIKSLLRDRLRMSAAGLANDVWHFEARYNTVGVQEWRSFVQFTLPGAALLPLVPAGHPSAAALSAPQASYEFRAPPSSWYLLKTQSTEESAVAALGHMRRDRWLKNLFLRPVPPLNDSNPISAVRNAVRDRSAYKGLLLDERITIAGALFHAQLFYGDQCVGQGEGAEKVLAKTEASIDALRRWNRAVDFLREKSFEELVPIQWLELSAE